MRGKALARFRRERLGFIFQDCNLLDTLTAFENIALALSILRTPPNQVRRRVVFLRDGQIFLELHRDGVDRKTFFARIIRVVTQLGGEMEDVL